MSTLLAGPAGAELEGRIARACARAEGLLGIRSPPGQRGDPGNLPAVVTRLTDRLGARSDEARAEHEAALTRLRERYETRVERLARAHAAGAALREITAPAVMLERAPAALCAASNFERVILSLISGGVMVAHAAHFAGEAALADEVLDALRTEPIALEHPLIETEVLRRRRATLLLDASVHPRVDRRLARLMNWSAYAAAPLVIGSRVLGVVHADRGPGATLEILDRDVLWSFVTALGPAYESASLVRTLRDEREQMRDFVDWLGARSGELTDGPVRLATVLRERRPARAPAVALGPPAARDERSVFEGLLTRRELDVLELVADGLSNKAIAEALVISDGTVKFHVNSILRKLRVANRAQAVARYLRLLGLSGP
ncbi:MAG: helix-turn-helix domain-containing protein [Solirubrobacteraceae bacterium]